MLWENLYSGPFFYTEPKMNSWLREKNIPATKIKNKFTLTHRVTNKDIKITNYVYFLKNDKNVSLSRENWYNLAKINVGVPRYFDKAIEVYRSKYEKSYVQKVEKEAEALDYLPYPGEIGKKIQENISKEGWELWVSHQTMLINEMRLTPVDPKARKFLEEEMEKFFFGDGSQAPQGFVPEK